MPCARVVVDDRVRDRVRDEEGRSAPREVLRAREPARARRDQRRHRERREIDRHDVVRETARDGERAARRDRERARVRDARARGQHDAVERPAAAAVQVLEHAIRSGVGDEQPRGRAEREVRRVREAAADHGRAGAARGREAHDTAAVVVDCEHVAAVHGHVGELGARGGAERGHGAGREIEPLHGVGRLGVDVLRIGEVERRRRRREVDPVRRHEPGLHRGCHDRAGRRVVAPDLAGAAARHEQRAVARPQCDAARVAEADRDRLREHARERAAPRVEAEHRFAVLPGDEQLRGGRGCREK